MEEQILYAEKKISTGLTIILGFFTLSLLIYFIVQIILGPIGDRPAPSWYLGAFTLFFILTTLNFMWFKIVLTDQRIKVSYGILGTHRRWEDIGECEKDEKNYFYGWGVRFGKYKHHWIWIYNVIGGPRVVFLPRNKKPKGLMISTSNPDEVISIAKERLSAIK